MKGTTQKQTQLAVLRQASFHQDSSHPISASCPLPKFMRELKAARDKIFGYYGTKICALGTLKVSAPNFLKKAYKISNAL